MNEIQLCVKKTDLQAHTDYELECLCKKQPYFLDCEFEKSSDDIIFTFNMANIHPLSFYKTYSMICRYRILLSLRAFLRIPLMYEISLNPKYLYVDSSFQIFIMNRDIAYTNYTMEVEQLKALIGYFLQDQYSYEDYYYGGMDLLRECSLTKAFYEQESIDALMGLLEERLNEALENEKHMVSIPKRKMQRMKIRNGVGTSIGLLFIILFIYFGVYKFSCENLFNLAQQAYIQQDYSQVIEKLENISVKSMNVNLLTILSEAYVKSEPLSQEQKNNILSTISIRSDQRILEYWVDIGRNEANEAIDLAHQLNNAEYLAYGYMKKQELVESDVHLSVKEKQAQLDEIESQLKKLEVDE